MLLGFEILFTLVLWVTPARSLVLQPLVTSTPTSGGCNELGGCDERYHRNHALSPSAPIVAGTRMIVNSEMQGKLPLFVDAFLNAKQKMAFVIMSFTPYFVEVHAPVGIPQMERWTKHSSWTCVWQPSAGNVKALYETVMTQAVVMDSTPPSLNTTDAKVDTQQFDFQHHTVVLGCPSPKGWRGEANITLTAQQGHMVVYRRPNIPVSSSTFVKPSVDAALCTMVTKDDLVVAQLEPWTRYHLALGFDQVLVYVEEEDLTWVEKLLSQFVKEDRVTLVPFFFGKVSAQRRFFMQGAMEQHCIYQAKGHAKWLGHTDVDEYFEPMGIHSGSSLKTFLGHLPDSTAAVWAQSAFWSVMPGATPVSQTFPCYISCKNEKYFGNGDRSKWIVRPHRVYLANPHKANAKKLMGWAVYEPSPDHELRLNHYKGCLPNSDHDRCFSHGNKCSQDLLFQERCAVLLTR